MEGIAKFVKKKGGRGFPPEEDSRKVTGMGMKGRRKGAKWRDDGKMMRGERGVFSSSVVRFLFFKIAYDKMNVLFKRSGFSKNMMKSHNGF